MIPNDLYSNIFSCTRFTVNFLPDTVAESGEKHARAITGLAFHLGITV